jgi:hypothetical protein
VKRLLAIMVLGLLAAGFACGQDWEDPDLFKRLGLEEQQMERIRELFEQTEREIREARVEIDVLKSQLRKELFQEQVQMREVERLLRQSLDWELKERMAQIRRQVELREMLGDAKYARLMQRFETRRRIQEEPEREREPRQDSERAPREERERSERGRP